LYDGAEPIGELNSSGAVTAVNTFGAGGLLSRHTSAGSVFYQFDPQGNVAQRLDSNQNVLTTFVFDAYGTELSGGNTGEPWGYGAQVGYNTDSETGLILCTHRYYDPGAGRWLNRDPIGVAGGVNLYAYVGDGPVGGVDRSGYVGQVSIGVSGNICTGLAGFGDGNLIFQFPNPLAPTFPQQWNLPHHGFDIGASVHAGAGYGLFGASIGPGLGLTLNADPLKTGADNGIEVGAFGDLGLGVYGGATCPLDKDFNGPTDWKHWILGGNKDLHIGGSAGVGAGAYGGIYWGHSWSLGSSFK